MRFFELCDGSLVNAAFVKRIVPIPDDKGRRHRPKYSDLYDHNDDPIGRTYPIDEEKCNGEIVAAPAGITLLQYWVEGDQIECEETLILAFCVYRWGVQPVTVDGPQDTHCIYKYATGVITDPYDRDWPTLEAFKADKLEEHKAEEEKRKRQAAAEEKL